jgi:putative transcriptional regulator
VLSKGKILISEPYLDDSGFERSVILLCEHNDSGAFGFMLNKATSLTVNSVMEDEWTFEQSLFIGGPVSQDSLFFIVRQAKPQLSDSVHIKDDLYWGGDFEHLKNLIEQGEIEQQNCRFFLGYSGWSEEQLEHEIQHHSWIVSEISTLEIFENDPDKMWQNVLKSMGGKYKALSNYPIDPRLN